MTVITRVWHGRTKAEHVEEYLQYIVETGVADYKSVPGNRGVEIWRRLDGDVCHFWTVTRWDSYDSIEKFAGKDVEKARYYEGDAGYLLEFEEKVMHCETFSY